VNGAGGFEIALACDMIVASEDAGQSVTAATELASEICASAPIARVQLACPLR